MKYIVVEDRGGDGKPRTLIELYNYYLNELRETRKESGWGDDDFDAWYFEGRRIGYISVFDNFYCVHHALARVEDEMNRMREVTKKWENDDYKDGYLSAILMLDYFINDGLDISDLVEED